MKAKKKTMTVINIIALVCLLIAGYFLGVKSKGNRERILKNGQKGVAVVINRTSSLKINPKTISYQISYDFLVGDKLFVKKGYEITKEEYERSVVGMQYELDYLNNRPHINSIIHIDKPVKNTLENIEKERQRILETHKNAGVFLGKNARPLEEIQHLVK